MNWYANEMLIRDSIKELHSQREMERLASVAQGDDEGVGLEDLLSARALVARITVRSAEQHVHVRPHLAPARATR